MRDAAIAAAHFEFLAEVAAVIFGVVPQTITVYVNRFLDFRGRAYTNQPISRHNSRWVRFFYTDSDPYIHTAAQVAMVEAYRRSLLFPEAKIRSSIAGLTAGFLTTVTDYAILEKQLVGINGPKRLKARHLLNEYNKRTRWEASAVSLDLDNTSSACQIVAVLRNDETLAHHSNVVASEENLKTPEASRTRNDVYQTTLDDRQVSAALTPAESATAFDTFNALCDLNKIAA